MDESRPLSEFRLPRGRHALPREVVAENQRWRLLAAVTEEFHEKGFASVRSSDVAARASVSRGTFYDHFDNVADCILAAYETAADCLVELAADGCRSDGRATDRIGSALAGMIDFLAAEPAIAGLLGAEAPAGVAAVAAARHRLVERLAALLRNARERPRDAPAASTEHARRLVEGALGIVADRLRSGEVAQLPTLGAELNRLLVSGPC